jgi:hypothetical protein
MNMTVIVGVDSSEASKAALLLAAAGRVIIEAAREVHADGSGDSCSPGNRRTAGQVIRRCQPGLWRERPPIEVRTRAARKALQAHEVMPG